MDESKGIAQVIAAYEKLLRQSGRIRALEKKLAEGTITMKEGAELNDLRAKAFGRALSGSVTGIERGSREGACVSLLKDRCADVDKLALAAQKTALTRQGLTLTPPTAPFEEERARKIGRSLEDETVPDETIQRRARSATENMLNSQYDRDMERGAKTCSDAGLRTYIVRDADPGCCAWCSAAAGRYTYGEEPKDVYRRHDNCSCTVVYESGRGRQNVWSKQTWSKEQEREYLELRDELKAKKRTEAPNVKKPVRLSEKEVQAIINKVGGLTFGGNGGTINIPMYRKGHSHRYIAEDGFQIIDKATYHKITNPAKKSGADIRIATGEWLEHLNEENARAVTIGAVIYFRPDATVSDVLEEVHHFYQNKRGLNDEHSAKQRTVMNEIDAKQFVLSQTKKYNIPQNEVEQTKAQLNSYISQMEKMKKEGNWE